MNLKNLFILIAFLQVVNAKCLTPDTTAFKPEGKPILKVFSNFHSALSHDESGFEVTRAYFGYQYQAEPNLSMKIVFDIDNPVSDSKLQHTAYLRNAALTWSKNNLTIDFGMINLKHFKFQENNWGYRYVQKSFAYEYKFGPSADLGVMATYNLKKYLSFDVAILNGEGYKEIQSDETFKGTAGLTATPVKHLVVRMYVDYSYKNIAQHTLAAFIGYELANKFRIGCEYNQKENAGFIKDMSMDGFSAYSTIHISKKFSAFARYDKLYTKTPLTPDNIIKTDSDYAVGGIQYKPSKHLVIAPNFRFNISDQPGVTDMQWLYLNLEFKL